MLHMIEPNPASAIDPDSARVPWPLTPGTVERWEPAPLAIDPWLVLRLSGHRRRDTVPPPIWEAARRMAERAAQLVEPRAVVRVSRVAATGSDAARRVDGFAFSGRAVATLLAGCPSAVTFVLTLGPRLEAETASLGERRELLEAFLLDTAGWAAIETAARDLRLGLAARARSRGWRLTHRLAPGYLDWPLDEQRALLGLVGDAAGSVQLSEHGVLIPFKSISGLFGLAPARAAAS